MERTCLPRGDDVGEVGVHQLGDDVDVLPEQHVGRGRQHDVEQRENVLVPQVSQQAQLAQQALARHDVVERVGHLLDGHLWEVG